MRASRDLASKSDRWSDRPRPPSRAPSHRLGGRGAGGGRRLSSAVALALLAVSALTTGAAAAGKAGTVEVVGNSGVSAQMMFLQSQGQVVIIDKVENNPVTIGNRPATSVLYNYETNKLQPIAVRSNVFCAGGATMGDGTWLVTGGNKAVGPGGVDAQPGAPPYGYANGGKALRFMKPCNGASCQLEESEGTIMEEERWYPTLEPMRDGYIMIIGGMRNGGYVPSKASNEPSYEFWPKVPGQKSVDVDFLQRTVPLSLYPITYLLSDNRVFMQANKETILWSTDKLEETKLPDANVPRVYPASGGSALLPLRPDDGYLETVLMCGGTDLGSDNAWGNEGGPRVAVSQFPASDKCQSIAPLAGAQWKDEDPLPEARTMGQFIQLPDGTLWFGTGAKTGTAGYNTNPQHVGKPVGQSFADNPSFVMLVYDPRAPAGQRWSRQGTSTVPRLYHSSATLLPDSSVLISGSNPNADFTTKKWPTEYRVERWYPSFYDRPRPSNDALPLTFSYGGQGFSVKLRDDDEARKAKVVVIRTGFSTHGLVMGQRMIELRSAVAGDGSGTLQVAQLPPNPSLFAPGPALAFVVVDGVPSQGKFVMVGNGKLGAQTINPETQLAGGGNANAAPKPNADAKQAAKKLSGGGGVQGAKAEKHADLAQHAKTQKKVRDRLWQQRMSLRPHLSERDVQE